MAEHKKSFVLYSDLLKSIEHLTNEEKGILFNHILEYVNDLNPDLEDRLILTAWKPIELQLKRDLKEWNVIKEDRSKSGVLGNLKRWNIDLYDKVISKEMTIEEAETIAKHRKASHPDKNNRTPSHPIANIAVNVTDNVNVNVNDNVDVLPPPPPSLENDIRFLSIDECRKTYDTYHGAKKETICMAKRLTMEQLAKLQDEFDKGLKTKESSKLVTDYVTHFANWANKEYAQNFIIELKKPQSTNDRAKYAHLGF